MMWTHSDDSRTSDPDAPVVIRFPALGDAVLLTPLLAALARRYGRPVHLLTSGAWTPIVLGHDPAVGEIRSVSSRRAPYWLTPSQWTAVRWLRAHRGPIYLCERDEHAARLLARAGLPAGRIVRAWDHHPAQPIHWADWWLQVARLDAPDCPGPHDDRPDIAPLPRLHAPAEWTVQTREWLAQRGLAGRALVLIQPGNKKTHKRGRIATAAHDKHWPSGHWAEVIRGVLAGLPGAAVLVCGSPREAGLVQEIVDATGAGADQVLNIAREAPLPRLVGLAALAHSMISVDTGPAHVAGAMDCPLVVLYGRFGWLRWVPRTAGASVVPLGPREPDERARLLDLTPAAVLAAWHTLRPRATAAPVRSGHPLPQAADAAALRTPA
ncbi:glycosyl transferase family 9 [Leptothrix cholodnii SP-6]|uniref:Glycosyl transferase family 9 n=1 Tax=Leptothrix cholodnii (strain ATCC 51168 / LMG 8142 / SP-6) TaxID=395495 RepID=B1XX58_LEPCP|nr:glycosyltransferase family 9 protein [Leptothrix cholodnii]ACB32704.1 glycosyl transferase family 9 [Leptothrix cholodnii SP-6]